MDRNKSQDFCSFCERKRSYVKKLVSGPRKLINSKWFSLFICDVCIKIAYDTCVIDGIFPEAEEQSQNPQGILEDAESVIAGINPDQQLLKKFIIFIA